jgi:hypothetical protein
MVTLPVATTAGIALMIIWPRKPSIRINKSRIMRLLGHVARMGVKTNAYRVLVGNPEGRSSLGRPRNRWDGNHK